MTVKISFSAYAHAHQKPIGVVTLVDIHAELPMRNHAVYTAAKGGLAALTRALARDLGPEIRVNGVAPGTILWPDDVAKAVQFLLADAPYITGQIIAVDGGRSISL